MWFEIITGPEFVTGSTRMKGGTSQKLILDMISTTLMIRLGRIEGNKMVNVKLMNAKLINRAARIFMERHPEETDYQKVVEKLMKSGSIKAAEKAE
jgi:N-acetylmuramic acid 6-phosphate etherase